MITALPAPPTAPKVRQVTGWLVCRPSDLRSRRARDAHRHPVPLPGPDRLVVLVKGFAEMMVQRTGENLENWLSTWKPMISPS
jgi:hypothetical protein